jgi:prefoldin beta subunit
MADDQLQRLQMLDHNLQQLAGQKQQFQAQLFEVENALKELVNAPTAYKIIGNVMVATDKNTLVKELNERKELIELRIASFEKQDKQLRDKVAQLQQTVQKSMKKE